MSTKVDTIDTEDDDQSDQYSDEEFYTEEDARRGNHEVSVLDN